MNTQPHRWINKSWKVVHCGERGHHCSVLQPLDKQGHQNALYLAMGHTTQHRKDLASAAFILNEPLFSPVGVPHICAFLHHTTPITVPGKIQIISHLCWAFVQNSLKKTNKPWVKSCYVSLGIMWAAKHSPQYATGRRVRSYYELSTQWPTP